MWANSAVRIMMDSEPKLAFFSAPESAVVLSYPFSSPWEPDLVAADNQIAKGEPHEFLAAEDISYSRSPP